MAKTPKPVEKTDATTPEVKIVETPAEPTPQLSASTLAELEAGRKALAKQAANR